MLISPKNTLTDTSWIMFDQILGCPMAQSSWHRKITITPWKTPQQGKGKKYSRITAWVKLKEITRSETKHSRKMLRTVWFHLFDILEVTKLYRCRTDEWLQGVKINWCWGQGRMGVIIKEEIERCLSPIGLFWILTVMVDTGTYVCDKIASN